jgi:hypothetical protein
VSRIRDSVTNIPERGARIARREERAYREYASDEQRSEAGCIAGRMPAPFVRWVLVDVDGSLDADSTATLAEKDD